MKSSAHEDLADLARRSSVLVASAQRAAAQSLLGADGDDVDDLLALDDDVHTTLVAAEQLHLAARSIVDQSATYDVRGEQLLQLGVGPYLAIQDAGRLVRGSAMGALRRLDPQRVSTFTVQARLHLLWSVAATTPEPAMAGGVDPEVRARALGIEPSIAVYGARDELVRTLRDSLATDLHLPEMTGEDPHMTLVSDNQVEVTLALAADGLARAERWARWIYAGVLYHCPVPMRLGALTLRAR